MLSSEIGFALPGAVALDAGRALELLEVAADAGFDPVLSTEVCGVSATSIAAALGARRPGVRTGTCIVPLGSRSEPALAMEATTAAQIAGGTFLLGVGTSTSPVISGWHGRTHDPSLATTRQRLRTLRAVLRGERRGSFRLPVPAADRVRVLLAALGPAMTDLALTEADGVVVNHTTPAAVPEAPADRMVLAFCWVTACQDGEARARRELISYMVTEPYARHFTRLGFGAAVDAVRALHRDGRLREAPATLPASLIDTLYVAPDGLPDRLRAYHRAGALPVVVPVTGDDPYHEITALLRGLRVDAVTRGRSGSAPG
jgi:alkanesulfonate monooxygenase SsuD/methylene tetrahydromethanopterin reductase-like flavin-dependent oxidoreductase (luciferase family)